MRFADRIDFTVGWISLIAILLACAAMVFVRARHPGFPSSGAEECRTAYHRAKTSTDSAIIDARLPATGAARDPNAPTCKTFRLAGELR